MSGWVKLHRKIVDSDIYVMPPLYLRVFERLILEANHSDKEIPYRYPGAKVAAKILIRRGERLTSIREICHWVGWYEYGVFKVPNPKTINEILNWLVVNNMIQIYPRESNRQGTHYSVVNYSHYQAKDSEKVTVEEQLSADKVNSIVNYQRKQGNSEGTISDEFSNNEVTIKSPAYNSYDEGEESEKVTVNNRKTSSLVTVTGSKQEYIRSKQEDIYILTQDEEAFLNTLSQIENYPLDRKRDLEMYRNLAERYSELDLCEAIEQWRVYKLDKPLTERSNPRSQINMSFKKYMEWGKCPKKTSKEDRQCQKTLSELTAHYNTIT